jgi:ribokinase
MLHEPVDAVDTTGAGDCFTGAFASYVAAGLTLEEAMELAVRVASFSVLSKGCQSSYRELEQLPEDLQAPLVTMIRGRSTP